VGVKLAVLHEGGGGDIGCGHWARYLCLSGKK